MNNIREHALDDCKKICLTKEKMSTKKKSKTRDAFNKGVEIDPIIDIPIDENDSIEQMFKNEQNANQDNVKELFHEEKVKARTDISPRQVKLITKAYLMGKLTGIKDINSVLLDFLILSISKDRKSRAEYVEGLKAKIENDINKGMMNVRGQFGK